MLHTALTVAAGVMAVVFLALFLTGLFRKDQATRTKTLRWATTSAVIAGLLMMLGGVIGAMDMMSLSAGFLLLVFGTSVQLTPRKT